MANWPERDLARLLSLDEAAARDLLDRARALADPNEIATFLSDLLGLNDDSIDFIERFIMDLNQSNSEHCKSQPKQQHQSEQSPKRQPQSAQQQSPKSKQQSVQQSVQQPVQEPKQQSQPQPRKPKQQSQSQSHSQHKQYSKQLDQQQQSNSEQPKQISNRSNRQYIKVDRLDELAQYIHQLEVSQRDVRPSARPQRRCDCAATMHPLNSLTPNCLNCGKIVCAFEGIGPCTFCGRQLLTREQYVELLGGLKLRANTLKQQRHNRRKATTIIDSHRSNWANPSVSLKSAITPVNRQSDVHLGDLQSEFEAAEHKKEKLIKYEQEDARRTKIIDQIADFDDKQAALAAEHAAENEDVLVEDAASQLVQLLRLQKELRGPSNKKGPVNKKGPILKMWEPPTDKQMKQPKQQNQSKNSMNKPDEQPLDQRVDQIDRAQNLMELQKRMTRTQLTRAVELASALEPEIRSSLAAGRKVYTSASGEQLYSDDLAPLVKDYLLYSDNRPPRVQDNYFD